MLPLRSVHTVCASLTAIVLACAPSGENDVVDSGAGEGEGEGEGEGVYDPFPPTSVGPCADNRDCVGGSYCARVDVPVHQVGDCGSRACESDEECSSSSGRGVCASLQLVGQCRLPCRADGEWFDGCVCEATGHCALPSCTSDLDCPAAFDCAEPGATDDLGGCRPRACVDATDCPGDARYCLSGFCSAAGRCRGSCA